MQVLYQAVNYQMEPVITETDRDVDETDSPQVCGRTSSSICPLSELSKCVSILPFSLCVFLLLHI